MKKTLIALAALAATGAFAQSVSISGNADIAFNNKTVYGGDKKIFAKTSGIADGLNSPNRIILNISEDLGGGMKAAFVNEHAISPTNGQDWGFRTASAAPQFVGGRAASTTDAQIPADGSASTATNRQSHITLSGNFGHVRAGYLVASLYNASAQSGYFIGAEQYGALLKDYGMGEVGNNRAKGYEYKSPKLGMFTGTVQVLNGTDLNFTADGTNQPYTSSKLERMAYRLDMDAGALKSTYVRDDYKKINTGANGVGLSSLFGVPSLAGTTTAAGAVTAKATTADSNVKATHDHLSTIYTMGNIDATWQYNRLDLTDNVTSTLSRNGKSNQYGIQYRAGAASFFAITGSAKVKQTSNGATVNDISNTQFGVRYALSKRTLAYFFSGTSKDSIPTAADKMSKGTVNGLGVMHAF